VIKQGHGEEEGCVEEEGGWESNSWSQKGCVGYSTENMF